MAMPLLLASASPRRKEILTLLDIPFEVCPAVRESAPAGLPPAERVQALARCKAEEVAAAHPNRLVVGADTMVVLDGRALGKPRDEAEAVEMLLSLQGKTHVVMTGVWVCSPGK
ncbi:MAG: Maf-like protein, partial [Oscillospiraceae bacterium]|nr:Maf-like protein [Oscillospiraceae bacterium]